MRDHFEANLRNANLSDWVEIRQGKAVDVARTWNSPIDLLLLDGEQSPDEAESAYRAWIPFLRNGGSIVVHNSAPGDYAHGHNGNRLVALWHLVAPKFVNIRLVAYTTFAQLTENNSRGSSG